MLLIKPKSTLKEIESYRREIKIYCKNSLVYITEYKTKKDWYKHIKSLISMGAPQLILEKIDGLKKVLGPDNLPMVVVRTSSLESRELLRTKGFKKLEDILV